MQKITKAVLEGGHRKPRHVPRHLDNVAQSTMATDVGVVYVATVAEFGSNSKGIRPAASGSEGMTALCIAHLAAQGSIKLP
jgi:hypothetical protein